MIVGHDRNINYYKIQYATLCIRENPGCQFIATNLDAVTHLTDAQEWAGNGAMVGAIKGMAPPDKISPNPECSQTITHRVLQGVQEVGGSPLRVMMLRGPDPSFCAMEYIVYW